MIYNENKLILLYRKTNMIKIKKQNIINQQLEHFNPKIRKFPKGTDFPLGNVPNGKLERKMNYE